MTLEENLVSNLIFGVGSEEMIEPDLEERRGGGEGGDVSADARGDAIGTHNHGHRVPADKAL